MALPLSWHCMLKRHCAVGHVSGGAAVPDLLQAYCWRWGLTVNTETHDGTADRKCTQQAALQMAERAQPQIGGQPLEAVSAFKYLGITFSSTTCLAGTAAPARA